MITGKQRSYLRKLGQELEPVVYIGKGSMSENVIREMDNLLKTRELIKVKLQEGCSLNAKEAANEAAGILGAEFVQAIGRRFVLYRQAEEKENRKVVLP
ncbi:MAG: YhbY family RNA-binding protein [Clostridiales bacterium]|nr:YhbY family RNA-binding protein [Clostridiales bacterium]MDD7035552.1 YhbY family RNA-binding protein [Bacillota bacterium]MDY2919864.1 YhbY family RNA-binding protein [Lentihominibacter sp.]